MTSLTDVIFALEFPQTGEQRASLILPPLKKPHTHFSSSLEVINELTELLVYCLLYNDCVQSMLNMFTHSLPV